MFTMVDRPLPSRNCSFGTGLERPRGAASCVPSIEGRCGRRSSHLSIHTMRSRDGGAWPWQRACATQGCSLAALYCLVGQAFCTRHSGHAWTDYGHSLGRGRGALLTRARLLRALARKRRIAKRYLRRPFLGYVDGMLFASGAAVGILLRHRSPPMRRVEGRAGGSIRGASERASASANRPHRVEPDQPGTSRTLRRRRPR
jgi:hypothetical protein